MSVTVAPLTTTVMGAVHTGHDGVGAFVTAFRQVLLSAAALALVAACVGALLRPQPRS